MPSTFELIQTINVATAQANLDFTSIPQTFTDLALKVSATGTGSGIQDYYLQFNGATTNMSYIPIRGNGSTGTLESSGYGSGTAFGDINYLGTDVVMPSNDFIYIPNYTSANYKIFWTESGADRNTTTAYFFAAGMMWSDTAAINRIKFSMSAGNFAQYSTVSLYGIKNS